MVREKRLMFIGQSTAHLHANTLHSDDKLSYLCADSLEIRQRREFIASNGKATRGCERIQNLIMSNMNYRSGFQRPESKIDVGSFQAMGVHSPCRSAGREMRALIPA